jgi:AcrR family transcriptional regulator
MPKVSDEHVAERREHILRAATTCFARSGIHRATVDDICAEAGISKGAIYGYIKSKDDVVAALQVEAVQADAALVRRTTRQTDSARGLEETLRAAFGALNDPAATEGLRVEVMLATESLLSQRLADAQTLDLELWTDALELVVKDLRRTASHLAGQDPRSVALALTAAIQGAAMMKAAMPELDTASIAGALAWLRTARALTPAS